MDISDDLQLLHVAAEFTDGKSISSTSSITGSYFSSTFTVLLATSSLLCFIPVLYLGIPYCRKWLERLHKAFMAHVILTGLLRTYNEVMATHKRRLFAGLHDMMKLRGMEQDSGMENCTPLRVVEIGSGGGANFKFFPYGTEVICVEPNDYCEQYLRRNALESFNGGVSVAGVHVCCAEDMSVIASESADAVVSTLVLCSVKDVDQCLREIRRILKPAGRFFFLEHIVAEPGTWVLSLQQCFNALRVYIAECHFTRATHTNIENAGFSHVDMKLFHAVELQQTKSLLWRIAYLFVTRHAIGEAIK